MFQKTTIKTLVYILNEVSLFALLVGNDQLNEVSWKTASAPELLWTCNRSGSEKGNGSDFSSVSVDLPEMLKIIASQGQDSRNAVVGANETGYPLDWW